MMPNRSMYQRGKSLGFRKARPKSKKWYEIFNATGDEGGDEATVKIYDEIDEWYGVSAGQFTEDLDAITAATIRVRINSPGGVLTDGMAIYHALLHHPAHVITQVDGVAASIASVIALAGDEVYMAGPGAYFMIHNPWGLAVGDSQEMLATAALLEKMEGELATLYADKSDLSATDARDAMAAETWYTGSEAVAVGFADGIIGEADVGSDAAVARASRGFNFGAYRNVPLHLCGFEWEGNHGQDDRRQADYEIRIAALAKAGATPVRAAKRDAPEMEETVGQRNGAAARARVNQESVGRRLRLAEIDARAT